MPQEISLANLSFAEKLQLLERVWDDICREKGDLRSPEWHRAILEARTRRLADGDSKISSWSDAKKRLMNLDK